MPAQIVANDVNSKLLELLSLRIGLHYAETISLGNSDSLRQPLHFEKIWVLHPIYYSCIWQGSSPNLWFLHNANRFSETIIQHDGEVPTDLELARIVAELAKYSCGEWSDTDYTTAVCAQHN